MSKRHSGRLSSHTLGSTESLKAVYMGKTFQSIKPSSPLGGGGGMTNSNAVTIQDKTSRLRQTFMPSNRKSNQSLAGAPPAASGGKRPIH